MKNVALPQLELSATQIETANICQRKWYLERVAKLPVERNTKSTVFGTVLHAVIERYLKADDLGRDENGNVVDLYPENWHIAYNRFDPETIDGEIDLNEQNTVKALIERAIKEGIISRQHNRQVEREFSLDFDLDDEGKEFVRVNGFMDLCYPTRVEDHKTTKSRRWAKTAEGLRDNIQMNLYGVERLLSDPKLDSVTLRHNTFVTDPHDTFVRFVEVTVSREEIQETFQKTLDLMRRMAVIKKTAKKWSDIDDPPNMKSACRAYGGCPFMSICGGREDEEGYRKRVKNYKQRLPVVESKPIEFERTVTMTQNSTGLSRLFANRMSSKEQGNAQTTTTPPSGKSSLSFSPQPVPVAEKPAAEPRPSSKPALGDNVPPPWANETCKACAGCGFNTVGNPCRMCVVSTEKLGSEEADPRLPDKYVWDAGGDGTMIWANRLNDDFRGRVRVAGFVGGAEVGKPTSKVAETSEPAKEPEKPEEPEEITQPVEVDAEKISIQEIRDVKKETAETSGPRKGRVGRPRKNVEGASKAAQPEGESAATGGVTVIWGAMVRGMETRQIQSVFDQYAPMVAESMGSESYWQCDVFRRKDAWREASVQLVKELQGQTIEVSNVSRGTDLMALAEAIAARADVLIQSVAV